MSTQIALVLVLTFVINLVGTLAYSVRIVGIKTGKIAISFSLFNIFVLVARTANALQAPLLAKTIDTSIAYGVRANLLLNFRWILFSAFAASVTGALLFPTFQRLFTKAVESFSAYRSVPKLLLHGFSKAGIKQFKVSLKAPETSAIKQLFNFEDMPIKVIMFNIIATALLTVGVLAPLFAGILRPELRTTCSTLTAVVNGFATILLFIFIDPYLSIMTDDVLAGKQSEVNFRRCTAFIVAGRIIGTLLAQFMLLPAAEIIAYIAGII